MEKLNRSIKSYVPESLALLDKDHVGARICMEDCAVLDPARDLLILQSRGAGLRPNSSFVSSTEMSEQEERTLLDALQEHPRFLMTVGARPLLVFADWLRSTGLILAILPHTSPVAAIRALRTMQREEIVILDEVCERASAEKCREAQELLADVLRFTDCIFAKSLPIPHFLLVLSTFSGCKLEMESTFFQNAPDIPISDRLSALLFCCLLYIRGIAGTATQNEAVACRLTLGYRHPAPNGYTPPVPAFLTSPCFSDIGVT